MPDRTVEVHLACNDPNNGRFAGEFGAVEFHVDDEHELGLEAAEPVALTFLGRSAILVGDYPFKTRGAPNNWVGNWCWDAVGMGLSDALRLARFLMERGFEPHEWHNGEPFGELVRKHSARGRRIDTGDGGSGG